VYVCHVQSDHYQLDSRHIWQLWTGSLQYCQTGCRRSDEHSCCWGKEGQYLRQQRCPISFLKNDKDYCVQQYVVTWRCFSKFWKYLFICSVPWCCGLGDSNGIQPVATVYKDSPLGGFWGLDLIVTNSQKGGWLRKTRTSSNETWSPLAGYDRSHTVPDCKCNCILLCSWHGSRLPFWIVFSSSVTQLIISILS